MHILSALINKVLNQKLFYEAYNSVLSGEFTITISTGDKTDNVSLELLYQKLISLSTPCIFNVFFFGFRQALCKYIMLIAKTCEQKIKVLSAQSVQPDRFTICLFTYHLALALCHLS